MATSKKTILSAFRRTTNETADDPVGPNGRLASASPEVREALRLKLNALIDEMDRLDALNGATDPSVTPG